jgi:hypothetical protein
MSASGWAGEKAARSGRSISPHPKEITSELGRIITKSSGTRHAQLRPPIGSLHPAMGYGATQVRELGEAVGLVPRRLS